MERREYYGKFLSQISTLLFTRLQSKRYAEGVSAKKTAAASTTSSNPPIAVTTRGGETEVDTRVLLARESVKEAIRTLSQKASSSQGAVTTRK